MKRGFTIIELLVVITVIAILVGVTMMSFSQFENRARDNQAKGLASALHAGVERYFSSNNEYPLAPDLYGGSVPGSCAAPASYTTASNLLAVPATTLGGDSNKLSLCDGNMSLGSGSDLSKVYYFTKPTATDATAYTLTIGGCTFTIPATDMGGLSYIIVYYAKANNVWQVYKSNHGGITSSDNFWCPILSNY